jgi:hypothetical protein
MSRISVEKFSLKIGTEGFKKYIEGGLRARRKR